MRVLGFLAFPLSTTIAAVANIVLLVWLLPRKIGRIDLKSVLRFFFALAGASAAEDSPAGSSTVSFSDRWGNLSGFGWRVSPSAAPPGWESFMFF